MSGTDEDLAFYQEVTRKVGELPGVAGVSLGNFTPWRDAGRFGGAAGIGFGADGYTPANGEENPRARLRIVAPEFFDVLGVPMLAGRDFTADDRRGSERGDRQPERGAAHLPERRRAQSQAVVDRSVLRSQAVPAPHRRRRCRRGRREHRERRGDDGVSPAAADGRGRPAVRARIRRSVRAGAGGDARHPGMSANQPVERAATLEDVRAEVLAPERLNAFVFTGFAGVALLIAVVGVAGVLAFGVSARTREFGVRLAIGSTPFDC